METKYKNTLKISTTDFSMRANLVQNAEKYQQFWITQKIYEKRLKQNIFGDEYILMDGPPYANGHIHIGHALNKILKDFIVRAKMMSGYQVDYCPGWDCHGLPIENTIEKNHKEKYINLNHFEKRDMCKKFALSQVDIQISQMQKLHLFSNFEKKYLTLDHNFQINELKVFEKLIEKNLLYWDLKPVFWSWSSKTTLAESEIIYQEIEETSIYWYFPIKDSKNEIFNNARLIIWTTTPYTIESNLAVLLNAKKIYVIFEYENNKYVCIKSKYEEILNKFEWKNSRVIHEFSGSDMKCEKYLNSLTDEINSIFMADFVTDETGTGIVHCAPGFGPDDYKIGLENNLKAYCPIDEGGHFYENCKFAKINGLFYKTASKVVIDELTEKNNLIKTENIIHKVGHDWRTKKPTLFRATKQWFLNIKEIKNGLEESFKGLNTYPDWLETTLKNVILGREEWCLSRQRKWGTIIPILFDNENPILDLQQIKHIISILDKDGINSWYNQDEKYFLLDQSKSSDKIKKSTDILDVWFDSGCAFANLNGRKADVYLEGFDQLRGWFNSSSILSYIVNKDLPFKKLIGHGFVLDGKGNKMSKSLGNVIDPLEIINKHGADILRLWVATNNYQEDIKVSEESFNHTIVQYRKIRNTIFRYSLSIIQDEKIDPEILKNLKHPENQYIYKLFCQYLNKALEEFDDFCYFKSIQTMFNFINIYSSWYLEISKDSLYCDSSDNEQRIEIVNIIHDIFYKSMIFFSIFIPQTAEEAYSHYKNQNKKESIFFEDWLKPQTCKYEIDDNFWDSFFKLRSQIYTVIEEAKNSKVINLINESSVTLNKNLMIKVDISRLIKYLNISELNLSENAENIIVKKTNLPFCERCKQAKNIDDQELCTRCNKVINHS